jgi:glycosyltransferase involved in cell wall biosynthesis
MKVSIGVITYNHEKYIGQALDGILQQQTGFPIEIIIGEDFSKDGTRAVCEAYANKYPEVIRLIPADRNIGMMENFNRTYHACTGDYIIFIEGDDYWTDPLKLQKQVNCLEANPDHSACFHNVIIKSERKDQEKEWTMHTYLPKDSFDTEDVLGPWFIATASFMFRNYSDFEFPAWFNNCKFLGDLPFMLLLSLRGNFKYIDEVMAVYRLHDTGMTTKYIGYDKIIAMVYVYESFNIHTNYKFSEKVRQAMIYEIDRHVPKPLTNGPYKVGETQKKRRTLFNKMRTIFK